MADVLKIVDLLYSDNWEDILQAQKLYALNIATVPSIETEIWKELCFREKVFQSLKQSILHESQLTISWGCFEIFIVYGVSDDHFFIKTETSHMQAFYNLDTNDRDKLSQLLSIIRHGFWDSTLLKESDGDGITPIVDEVYYVNPEEERIEKLDEGVEFDDEYEYQTYAYTQDINQTFCGWTSAKNNLEPASNSIKAALLFLGLYQKIDFAELSVLTSSDPNEMVNAILRGFANKACQGIPSDKWSIQ